jgi:hypothetical protein
MKKIHLAILSYLAENPDAQDTLNGISEWWLLGDEQAGKPNIESVEETLTDLVREGLVIRRGGEDRLTYYKLNRRRLKEISDQLKKNPED